MSYILDALRKAERERNLGRVPTLEDVTQAPFARAAPSPARGRLLFAALILGLLLLAYLSYVYFRPGPAISVDPLVPAATIAPVQQTAPASAEESASSPRAPADEADTALDPDTELSALDQLMEDEPPPRTLARISRTREPAGQAEEEFFEIQADPAPVATMVPDSIPKPPVAALAVSVPVPPPAATPPVPVPAAPTGPVLLRDMASDYRSTFPPIRIDVHVHDADPARRWMLINGKKYLEGSVLAEGPRVVQITAEGTVFDYRGRQVLIPLNR